MHHRKHLENFLGVWLHFLRGQSDCVHEQVAKTDCECPLY
ncbi:hypothetical protein HMPREF0373_01338 [Eubacterium ramulus ATCC 29099]|uniref:Uncharacterized protein n=1 Tax=Eubacterium ramulus ATCC 29099 TaxID=1256908 RepID=U2R0V1_EUBRA|nr:hypothetical protein HMPREF0373_01338 [Eubacterium ramulus ATCC 29099]